MFAYPDAARYRLGVNYQQLPCNRPVCEVYSPYQRDGAMRYMTNYGNDPNYVGSSLKPINFKGQVNANGHSTDGLEHEQWVGRVASYASEVTDEDFEQARMFWKVLERENKQDELVGNLVAHLGSAIPSIRKAAIGECCGPFPADLARHVCESYTRAGRETQGWSAVTMVRVMHVVQQRV